MHVALLANLDWLDEELTMFNHLVVGLIDEQVRVVQIVPDEFPAEEVSMFGDRLTWRDTRWGLLRQYRLAALRQSLTELDITLLHALDGQLWEAAIWLSRRMGIPVVLTASSAADVDRAAGAWRASRGRWIGFIALTEAIGSAIRRIVGEDAIVEVIPDGVRVPDKPRHLNNPEQSVCIVVSGDGQFDEDYEAVLRASHMLIREHPHVQLFLDGRGEDQHRIWQVARRLGLLPNTSLVSRRLGHHETMLGTDAMIHPQALGQSRCIMLQAMARGLPVMARDDPWLDYLIDGQTAWTVDRADPDLWLRHMQRIVVEPEAGLALGESARRWVREHHAAAAVVQRTLNLYRLVSDESLKFPQRAAS